jgi:hypothetical protein
MTTFVRILLVPLSAPLSYDFKGGGESTRDGRVKFTDLTEATGNGLATLAVDNTHLYKSSWTDVLKEFVESLERDPEYDSNSGDFTNQVQKMTHFQVVERTKAYEIHMKGSQALFEKPSLSRAESELKKKEQEGKTQKYDGLKKSDGGALTFTVNQVTEILESVCVHFGVDTHPICDKCHMRHNPVGGCVKRNQV